MRTNHKAPPAGNLHRPLNRAKERTHQRGPAEPAAAKQIKRRRRMRNLLVKHRLMDIDANALYYRAEVYDVTEDYIFALGNPIWNAALYTGDYLE